MKKVITTLSIGENYTRDYTCRLIEDVLRLTNIEIYITTDFPGLILEKFGKLDRIKITEVLRKDIQLRVPKDVGDFNFNMKYLCLIPVMDLDDTIIIFTDCDNSFDWWDEVEVDEFIQKQYQSGYDFFGPRTDLKWGNYFNQYQSQDNKEYGIFWHKICNYDLLVNPKPEWFDSPCPAEYLLIFVNNNGKLRKFTEQFKWFHDYLLNKESQNLEIHGTWAEGFEMGVSSYVAGFNSMDIGFCHPLWGKIFGISGYKQGPRAGIWHPTEK
jgi:hypothetical protein